MTDGAVDRELNRKLKAHALFAVSGVHNPIRGNDAFLFTTVLRNFVWRDTNGGLDLFTRYMLSAKTTELVPKELTEFPVANLLGFSWGSDA